MSAASLATRPAARILLVDGCNRVLLFRFTPPDRPPFWVTPGGAVDPGESYEQAAARELAEEVGLAIDCGPQVARREVEFLTLQGVQVLADERYFRIDIDTCVVDPAGHTDLERQVMREWRWFERAEIDRWAEPIYPADLVAMLDATDSSGPHDA
ncbi:NUDIX hydrolase [Sphingomonas carotinifaciens]|uniref:ADP-ribose pyrophosphatase YjhB, NUDIX family n=1 Tax=Sphingomonas carotinifaciens TaxID=1166323 RepID=A0A1G7NKW9_9SPHN|nr:NUDIX domain-containing protein [Sphingomonas carotinifaciens]MBB4087064.1 8-oxo-dGTP pyrophosphatase MutT (NUDIX family) [Sphingomonas carotinifaciens]MWC43247.1 NUDIX domain-containing protein [Sphingomonas carotinifaciens]SDF73900.1 ADP-ribose pyrophosphatase YjhB, NUDIX family [Sphingomonas carotinifaciens]